LPNRTALIRPHSLFSALHAAARCTSTAHAFVTPCFLPSVRDAFSRSVRDTCFYCARPSFLHTARLSHSMMDAANFRCPRTTAVRKTTCPKKLTTRCVHMRYVYARASHTRVFCRRTRVNVRYLRRHIQKLRLECSAETSLNAG
jgi:hypothetical protein